jgi:flagellin-like hook-associated protein FlgL
MRVTFGSIVRNGPIDVDRTTEEPAIRPRDVSSGCRIHLSSDEPSAMAAAMGDGSEMAVLDDASGSSAEDARLAESTSAMTRADAGYRAALGALATAGRLSLDCPK